MYLGLSRGAARLAVAAFALTACAIALAVFGSGTRAATRKAAHPTATPAAGVSVSSCGTKPGVKATGSPINVGAIADKEPGVDFSDGPNMVAAYFACVNANGGVNGHPLKLYTYFDQSNPAQISGDAKQLIRTDHVVAIDGAFDQLECTVDQSYWKSLGIYEIDSGISPECWSTSNSAAVNMGPRFSSDGAVQYAIAQHVKKIVFDQLQQPAMGDIAAGVSAVAKKAGVPIVQLSEHVPITNADDVALKEVQDAGPDGAVVLNFNPPDALSILLAAQKLGLEDRVKEWGCSTPCDTDFLAKQLGPKWNHKLFVNAELASPDDHNGPDMQLYKEVLAKYGHSVAGGIGAFSQMGFVEGKLFVSALGTVRGAYTRASVNKAIVGITGFKTDMLCLPWRYGKLAMHIPNNADWTTTPDNGKMVTVQGCQNISSADPQIAEYRKLAGQG